MRIKKKQVAALMLKAGLTNQRELAAKAGLCANTVSNLMRGASAKIETIGKIATALGVEPETLLEE